MNLRTQEPLLGDRFEAALVMAHRLHQSQVRKGSSVPYVSHLLSVAALVLEDGGDEDEAIAALLHDAVEDQGGSVTRELVRVTFGDRVCDMIDGCTESMEQPKPSWKERKLLHLEKVATASVSVRRVTMADKLHNVRSLLADYERVGEELWARFGGGKAGTIWYYQEMLVRLRLGEPVGMMRSLSEAVGRLELLL